MVKVTFVQPDGSQRIVEGAEHVSAMHLATANLVPGIVGECGGELSCATCHVFVDEAWVQMLPAKTPDEETMLYAAAEEPTATSRLCCQIRLHQDLDGIVLHVPNEQR